MWKWVVVSLIALAIILAGFSLAETGDGRSATPSALIAAGAGDASGFARALTPLDWQFPRDFGPHPEYQTEWWYTTGNLADANGARYGFQFTIFRRGLTGSAAPAGSSEWRSENLYMAHFTVTDVNGEVFYHEERFSREGAELAGASVDPLYRVWLGDWQVIAENDDATRTRITAAGDGFAVDLQLTQNDPPALHGIGGLSAKSSEPGNASHYYSLTRLATEGTITLNGQPIAVTGASWTDHEFSTSALGEGALGWDWFGLQLDDGRELMVGQIRLADGGRDPYFGGLLVEADGTTTRALPADAITIEATGEWASPHTGAVYPSGWRITVALDGAPLTLIVTPQLADQELHGGGIAYWEGSVRLSGDATGYGYAELTGYADAMTGRF